MQREIKFRAWLPNQKRMVYIGSSRNDTGLWISEDGFDVVDHFTGKPESMGTNDDGTILMQLIGLKDMNNKEIYEGDILLTDEAGWKGKVVYYRDRFMLEDNIGGYSSLPSWELCEIIGNIYENPELLEGENNGRSRTDQT